MSRNPILALVDLESQRVRTSQISDHEQQQFIGGFGLNVHLAMRYIPQGVDPLSPGNPIIIGSAPLAGTPVPGASRLSVFTKLPLNGAIGGNNGSMGFSYYMRWSGIDHLVILGAAPEPCYIVLTEQGVRFRNASDLWGLDTYEVTEVLYERHDRSASVMAIGTLGELQVPMALAFVDKAGTVGKGGLGAVMGSKRLKAIVAAGREPVEVAQPKAMRRLMAEISREMQADKNKDRLINLGTMAGWENRAKSGFPYKNWRYLYSKDKATEHYGPEIYLKKVKYGRASCLGCTLPDKEMLKVPAELSKDRDGCGGFTYASSFSGRAVNYGIRCGVGDATNVSTVHDAANRHGLCDHHWSATLDLAFELWAQGIIDRRLKGSELLYPGFKTTMELLEMTVRKEGIGELYSA